MKTFAQFKSQIIRQTWPSGQPEALEEAHGWIFQEALGLISKFVDCEKLNNVDVVAFCNSFYKCGMTIVKVPTGVTSHPYEGATNGQTMGHIKRVYTVVGADYCDPVFYRQVKWPGPECFGRQSMRFVGQLTQGGTTLPLGYGEADAANDAKCGRARAGIWAIHEGNIYIAPWIQSMENVVIEWDGIKKEWADTDLITNEDEDYRQTVKFYYQYAHERDYGSMERAELFHNPRILSWPMPPGIRPGHFDVALAELMWACRERTKTRDTDECLPPPIIAPTQVETGIPPVDSGMLTLAHVGRFSGDDAAVVALGNLCKGFASVIIGTGFLRDGGYDSTAGAAFHQFMSPYVGSHGQGSDLNAFWPAPATADWDLDSLASYLAYFTRPRYYDVNLGDLHLFVLDSDSREPDGNSPSSVQAQWLKEKLNLSPAPWKVVMMYDNAYSSLLDNAVLRWPFRDWGVDLLLTSGSRNYERLQIGSLPVIVNGLGGENALEPVPGGQNTEASYNLGYAVGKITARSTQLKYELVLTNSSVRDELTLSKLGVFDAYGPPPVIQPVPVSNSIDYPGPPVEIPPAISAIVVDSNGQQWQYWMNEWH